MTHDTDADSESESDERSFAVEVLVSRVHTVHAESMDEAVEKAKRLSVGGDVAKMNLYDETQGGHETIRF